MRMREMLGGEGREMVLDVYEAECKAVRGMKWGGRVK